MKSCSAGDHFAWSASRGGASRLHHHTVNIELVVSNKRCNAHRAHWSDLLANWCIQKLPTLSASHGGASQTPNKHLDD